MGNWHIAIDGHGVHDNGLPHDAEVRLEEFVQQLLADGHAVHNATFTVGNARTYVQGNSERPAHYKNLP